MRIAIVAGVVVGALLAPAAAQACTSLPAPSAKYVPISVAEVDDDTERTALRVCVNGRRVELARGTYRERDRRRRGLRIAAASAAGRRVAWIEERHRGGVRTATVSLAAVGREVRVLRRFTVHRTRTRSVGELDVLLTRHGDLAWTAGDYEERGGVVAVKQPGRATRRLADYSGSRLALEGGRTLRWDDGHFLYEFFDLRPVDCRRRSGYAPLGRNARVLITRTYYFGSSVVRGCDPATGRDRVILQNYSDINAETYLAFVGLDRAWAVFHQSEYWRDGTGLAWVTVVDALTGRASTAYTYNGETQPRYPAPAADRPFAVTDRGVLGWERDGVLYATAAKQRIVQLDAGAIAGLRADGDALVWTRDGVPRRVVPSLR